MMVTLHPRCVNKSKKQKWTRLHNRFASGEEYVQCQCAVQGVLSLQMHQWHQKTFSGHSGFAVLPTARSSSVSDDQGLIELLSHLNYFRAKPSISENYHCLTAGITRTSSAELQKLSQIMTKVRFELT